MSQGSYIMPTGGTVSMVVFAGDLNSGFNALASKNSGAGAPANGPSSAPQEFQDWFNNTNVNFPIWNMFDGVSWDKLGTLDVANANWLPKMGGGVKSVTSAATVDIGANPQTYLTITGTNTITSLGTSLLVGEEKKLQFSGSLTLTNNANIVTPNSANITTQAGDSCVAIGQGSGVTQIFGYCSSGLNDFTPWQSWTPVFTSSGGTLGTYTINSARYVLIGKTVLFHIDVMITSAGSSPTQPIKGTLPIAQPALNNVGNLTGYEVQNTGNVITGYIVGSVGSGQYMAMDFTAGAAGSITANSARLYVSGMYEASV